MSAARSKSKESQAQWSPEQVYNTCEKMQTIERVRASNRAIINNQFNGNSPYTSEEVEKYQIHINVNWGEGKQILIPAINQLNNALIFKEQFFTAQSKGGDIEKRDDFGMIFTSNFHESIKEGTAGLRQMFLLISRNASVALHGIGPIIWMNGFRWRGRFMPLEDLLIPTDTLCDFSNLSFFGANLYLTLGEFFDMACGEKVDRGWDTEMVNNIIKDLVKPEQTQNQNWQTMRDQPEKMVEWLKQNRCMWDYDSATTVKLRVFFYKHYKTKKWHRCIVLREGTPKVPATKQTKFLYDGSDKVFADDISHILHVQYGDNSICPPMKYQSVRGLGVDLYGPVECNNRTRSEFQQHVLQDLKTMLRIDNPVDRDRPKMLDLSQYSVIEDGIKFVPKEERHQIDPRLAEMAIGQSRQIMGEAGTSYVKDTESQTSQPRTATETTVLQTQATEAISNMLQRIYAQEYFYWVEEVRRWCDPQSQDEEVRAFQKKCIADGIPKELMVAKNWKVVVTRALGGGDQMVASQEAGALLSQSQRFDPTSQRKILKKWTTTITRDPQMAEMLVPDSPDAATPGVIAAEDVFGTLMEGIEATVRQGIDRSSYVHSLLSMMQEKVNQINNFDKMGEPRDVLGLQTCMRHVQKNIKILAADPTQQQNVKLFTDQLTKLSNEIRGFNQRQAQAHQKQQEESQIDPAVQAKVQSDAMLSQQKLKINDATTQQKLQQAQAKFEQQMQQQMEKHSLAMQTLMAETHAQLTAEALKTGSEIENNRMKNDADIEAKKKAEAAKPKTNGGPVK